MTKKFGFTLAEVLITLGIIGVVAAMTIPTLIANTNSAKFRSQYKKTVSTLNQAALMAIAQYDVDYSNATDIKEDNYTAEGLAAEDVANNTGSTTLPAIFKGTLTVSDLALATVNDTAGKVGYTIGGVDYVTTTVGADGSDTNALPKGAPSVQPLSLKMADGSMLIFSASAKSCSKPVGLTITDWVNTAAEAGTEKHKGTDNNCIGFIDVNVTSLPNKEVNCGVAPTIAEGTCEVQKSSAQMTDIYPVAFHDATVEPITQAARYVLTTSK